MDSASTSGHGAPARWSLRLFGTFELSALPGGERMTSLGKRERALLAALALSPDCRQPRRKLTTLLWGEAADETTFENLRTSVWRLRKALGDREHRLVASEGEDVVLDAAAFEVDALAFRRLAAQSDRRALETAATLYRGELLDGLDSDSEDFESWRRSEAARCRDQALDVLTRLMAHLSDVGETERAIDVGERILGLEPLHEEAVRRLMRLYAQSGRRGAAVQLYRALGDTLRAELDAKPEAATRALLAEIARGEERTPPPALADTKPPPPFNAASWSDFQNLSPQKQVASQPDDEAGRGNRAAEPGIKQDFLKRKIGKRASWLFARGLAAVVTALLLLYQFTSAVDPPSSSSNAISVAVLPFANLSSDPEQEFFSDGITDEITSALARVPGLRVVARTSAFQFKGQNRDLRAIGQSLGATHLIEGSVRKAGDQVRITVQLVQADNGLHVWTENYERNLTDIFAIQEEIAQAIAASLRVPLGLGQGQRLVSNRSIDPEAYQQFLRAKGLVRPRGPRGRGAAQAIPMLERLVARNADYAPAWGLLAQAYNYMPYFLSPWNATVEEKRLLADEWFPKAVAAAERAIQLDANLPGGYFPLGLAMAVRGNFRRAEELYSKALALDPFDPDALNFYAHLLGTVGRPKEALAIRQQLRSMEPFVPLFNPNMSQLLSIDGQNDEAIAMLRARGNVGDALADLAQIYSGAGRYSEAADALAAITPGDPENFPEEMVEAAVRLLRAAPAALAQQQSLPQLSARFAFVYVAFGAPERVLQPFEESFEAGLLAIPTMPELWHPSYAPVRRTARFKAFARNAGLVEYWRVKGWPAFCRPTLADDFVCE